MTDETDSTRLETDTDESQAERDPSEDADQNAATSGFLKLPKPLSNGETAWSGVTALQRQVEQMGKRISPMTGSAALGRTAAMASLDRHARITEQMMAPLGRWSMGADASKSSLRDFTRFSHFAPVLAVHDQSPMMRVLQGQVGTGFTKEFLSRSLLSGGFAGSRIAGLNDGFLTALLPRTVPDMSWVKGVLRINQQLSELLAAQSRGVATILGLSAQRFLAHTLDIQLIAVSQKFSDQGWLVDALLVSVPDEELQAITDLLEQAPTEEQPDRLLDLLHSVRSALTSNVEVALRSLLSPEDAEEFIRDVLHVCLRALLDEAEIRARMYTMVPSTALSRTEGVFKRAMHRAGQLTQVEHQVLFGNRPQDVQARDEVLATLHETFSNRPFRSNRDAIQISAFDRFSQQRTSLTSREEGPVPTRHHTLHDGAGTGTHEYALRTFLYFCSVTLILQSWLTEPPPLAS